jgi:YVTN family beta-propeller protein
MPGVHHFARITSLVPTLLRAALIGVVAVVVAGAGAPSIATAAPPLRAAYLLDFISQTLDRVDLDNGVPELGLVPVGIVPNKIHIEGDRAYVVNSLPATLQVIDLNGPSTLATVDLGVGSNPWSVAIAGSKAYVSLWQADQVAVVDLTTMSVVHNVAVGVSPEGLCRSGGELYVANSGFEGPGVYVPGTVSVIDLDTDLVTATIPVGLNAQWCATDGEGEVHVVCSDLFAANNGRVFILDPTSHTVIDSLRVGGFPGPISIGSNGIGWMTEFGAGLLAIDTITHTVRNDVTNPVDAGGFGALGLDQDRDDRIYVALSADRLLSVLEPDGTVADVYPIGPGPQDVAIFEELATPVVMSDLSAVRSGVGVELAWSIAGDEVLVCDLERQSAGSEPVIANDVPIRANADGWFTFRDVGAGAEALDYRIVARHRNGQRESLGEIAVPAAAPDAATAAMGSPAVRLLASPNPSAGAVQFLLQRTDGSGIAAGGPAEIALFDMRGRLVRVLDRSGAAAAGGAAIPWDGRDATGRLVPNGVYVARLRGGGGGDVAPKITILR